MTINNPYVSFSELTAFRRNRAFLNGDNDELLRAFNALIEENLNGFSYNRALFNLWSALSICEHASDEQQVMITLNYALNLSPFLHEIDDYSILIESIITNFIDKSSEITSTAYFILSVLFLNKQNFTRSYNYAKMAHFYALQLDESNNQPSLCNAQLQLIFSQLLLEEFHRAETYILQFGWHIENCQEVQERMLIQTIHLLKNTLHGSTEETDLLLFAEKLASSDKHFYPLYLLMQMKNIVHTTNNPTVINKVSTFYYAVQQQTLDINKRALGEYYLLRSRFITNSNLFFTRAEQLFDKIKKTDSEVYLIHLTDINLNLPSLYDFTMHAPEVDFLLYPLHHNEFLILLDEKLRDRLKQSLWEQLAHSKILFEIDSNSNMSCFIDLYVIYTQQVKKRSEN